MARPKITGRSTSVAAAFVQAIIPRSDDEQKRLDIYGRVGITAGKCVYCGVGSTDVDHFIALVKGSRPSGYFHTTANIVPACGTCNQSKSGQHWLKWMTTSRSKRSLRARGVPDIDHRVEILKRFAEEAAQEAADLEQMRQAAGPVEWDTYWAAFDEIKKRLAEAEALAGPIRERLDEWHRLREGKA